MTLPQDPPVVHLVDDEMSVRNALEFLFGSHGLPVRCYENGPQLLSACAHGVPLRGCVVLDVRMEPMSGLQVYDALLARAEKIPVIFLTGHGDIQMAVEALQKGALGFLEKPFGNASLVALVGKAMGVDKAQQQQLAADDSLGALLATLTKRELEVMHRVAAGKLNKVIADELNIAVRTVEVNRASVFAKLAIRSSAELATLLAQKN